MAVSSQKIHTLRRVCLFLVAMVAGYSFILDSMIYTDHAFRKILFGVAIQVLGIAQVLPATSGFLRLCCLLCLVTIPVPACLFHAAKTRKNHLTMEMLILISNFVQTVVLICLLLFGSIAMCVVRSLRWTVRRTMLIILITSFILQFMIFPVMFYRIEVTSHRMFDGIFAENNDLCQGSMPFPWMEYLPRRLLNFYTGSEQCPAVSFRSEVKHTTAAGVVEVHVTCAVGATVEDTHLKRIDPMPDGTFHVPAGTEDILVRCGTEVRRHVFYNREVKHERTTANDLSKSFPNILVLYIDSVSRPMLRRELPLTRAALEEHPDYVFQYLAHHLVGHSTTANTVPLITGYTTPDVANKHLGQHLPVLYRRAGYFTGFVAGACLDYIDDTFQTKAFNMTPPGGWDVGDAWQNFCAPDYTGEDGNFLGPYSILRRCMTDTYVHDHVFTYLESMWSRESHRNKFVVATLMEAHEGTQQVVHLIDRSLSRFLFSPVFADTLIVLMSDHGHHMGPYFEWTRAGRLEHLMPMLHFIFPPRRPAEENVARQLRRHMRTITTPYDMYRTLAHMVDYPSNETLRHHAAPSATAQSLFELSVPQTVTALPRTCEDAGVPDLYCVQKRCHLHDMKDYKDDSGPYLGSVPGGSGSLLSSATFLSLFVFHPFYFCVVGIFLLLRCRTAVKRRRGSSATMKSEAMFSLFLNRKKEEKV